MKKTLIVCDICHKPVKNVSKVMEAQTSYGKLTLEVGEMDFCEACFKKCVGRFLSVVRPPHEEELEAKAAETEEGFKLYRLQELAKSIGCPYGTLVSRIEMNPQKYKFMRYGRGRASTVTINHAMYEELSRDPMDRAESARNAGAVKATKTKEEIKAERERREKLLQECQNDPGFSIGIGSHGKCPHQELDSQQDHSADTFRKRERLKECEGRRVKFGDEEFVVEKVTDINVVLNGKCRAINSLPDIWFK